MKFLTYILFIAILLVSCSKSENNSNKINYSDPLLGTWVNIQFVDTAYTATRSTDFVDDLNGFKINGDGTFEQRINAGWCGTPPISYTNFMGTWTAFPDQTIYVETESWAGPTSFTFELLTVNENQLVYRYFEANN